MKLIVDIFVPFGATGISVIVWYSCTQQNTLPQAEISMYIHCTTTSSDLNMPIASLIHHAYHQTPL